MTEDKEKLVAEMTKRLVEDGKLIEAGFAALCVMSIPQDASPMQVHDMRMAFFAGAQHLLGSIMSILDPGSEPTEKDMQRMELISDELDQFIAQYKLKASQPQGHA